MLSYVLTDVKRLQTGWLRVLRLTALCTDVFLPRTTFTGSVRTNVSSILAFAANQPSCLSELCLPRRSWVRG